MPLEIGNKWSYYVRTALQSRVENLEVIKQMPVADTTGYLLESESGILQLAWKKNILYLQETPAIRFIPAIPWIDTKNENSEREWKGNILFLGKEYPLSINIQQEKTPYNHNGTKVKSIRSTLHFEHNEKSIELITWFLPEIGIVEQQHRTNQILDISQEYLSGPN